MVNNKIFLLATVCCIQFVTLVCMIRGNHPTLNVAINLSIASEGTQLLRPLKFQPSKDAATKTSGKRTKEIRLESESTRTSPVGTAQHDVGVHLRSANNGGISQSSNKLTIFILVKTGPNYFKRRQTTRELWFNRCRSGNYAGNSPHHTTENEALRATFDVHCLFVSGTSTNTTINDMLQREQEDKKDIHIAPFVDGYHKMTAKSQWSLLWVLLSQRSSDYVMLVDDDVYVVFGTLLPWLKEQPRTKFYAGHSHYNRLVVLCRHDPGHANCIDMDGYKERLYPHFASGFAYVLSRDAAALSVMQVVSGSVHGLPGNVEDAMLGVMLARSGVNLQSHAGFLHWKDEDDRCLPHTTVMVVGNVPIEILHRFALNEAADRHVCNNGSHTERTATAPG